MYTIVADRSGRNMGSGSRLKKLLRGYWLQFDWNLLSGGRGEAPRKA